MGELAMDRTETTSVEAILRDELARGNRALRGVAPVISHLLESSGQSLVSDAIIARLRGMLSDVARQLLDAGPVSVDRQRPDESAIDDLADALGSDGALLNHLHALAMESVLTERLQQRSSIDPVLSPLLQELIASEQPSVAELAMSTLAAQSRFIQTQRRMGMPLEELPADLFVAVLKHFEAWGASQDNVAVSEAIRGLKAGFDEGAGRLGLLARLVSSMKGGAIAALELEHAGLALFASGLATLTKQPRDLAVIACHQKQAARLALSLRAAGLSADAIERQFLLVEPSQMVPREIAGLSSERAHEVLSANSVDHYARNAV